MSPTTLKGCCLLLAVVALDCCTRHWWGFSILGR